VLVQRYEKELNKYEHCQKRQNQATDFPGNLMNIKDTSVRDQQTAFINVGKPDAARN